MLDININTNTNTNININNYKNKLLLVDDEPINIRQIGHLLESDYDIVVATSGQQALDIANKMPQPELILLDVLMPEMDGYVVCQKLKSHPKTGHIPVIFLTSNHKEEDESKGLELGAVDYIIKPFRPLVDLKRIKTHIQLHQDKLNLLEQFVDTLPFASFVVEKDLLVKSYNHLAGQLLSESENDFVIRNNKLIYRRETPLLVTLMDKISHIDDKESYSDVDNIQIIKSPTHNYRIFIMPLVEQKLPKNHSSNELDNTDDIAAHQYVIYINQYKEFLQIETQLKELYDLTTAEARLANGIINGLSLEEISEQGDLKYSTLKSYLKIIFQKTGTKKQHELVSAILRNFTCSL